MLVLSLKIKSDSSFANFQRFVENQFDRKIKKNQSDRGGEFTSDKFIDHLTHCGILRQVWYLHTHLRKME